MAVLQATVLRLASVLASTHKPQIMRHTMLHDCWCGNLSWCAMQIGGKNIDLPNHIPVSAETTLPTGIDPAAWFVPMPALWTGLTGVVLILKYDCYALGLGFVRNKGTDFAMTPSADFLVGACAVIDAIRNIPHIPKDESVGLPFNRSLDNGATHLMFHVAQHTGMLCFHAGLGPPQFLRPLRPFRRAADGFGEAGETLGMALLCVPTFSTGDERGFLGIAHHGGVNFAQINGHDIGSKSSVRLFPVFHHDMPGIAPGALVVDEAH